MAALDLNPESDNYIVKDLVIQHLNGEKTKKIQYKKGDEPNVSNYFRVEVSEYVSNAQAKGSVPFGFLGPVRPKGFSLVEASTGANTFGSVLMSGTKAKTVVTFGKPNGGHFPNNGETLAFNILGSTKTVVFNSGTDETAFQGDDQMEIDVSGKDNSTIVGRIKWAALDALAVAGVRITHVDNSGAADQIIIEARVVGSSQTVTATLGGSASGNLSRTNTTGVNDGNDFAGAFVKGNNSMPFAGGASNVFASLPPNYTASFRFPSLALRGAGSEGSPVSEYEVYYGIRPKTAAAENKKR